MIKIISPLTIAYASLASLGIIIWHKVSNPWREADRMIREDYNHYVNDPTIKEEDYF